MAHNPNTQNKHKLILAATKQKLDGFLYFSSIIQFYLKDPYDKAIARFLAKFVDEQVAHAGFRSLVKAEKGKEIAIKEAQALIIFLEKEVTGKDFFGGKTITFLDMVVGSMIPFCGVRAWEFMNIDMIPKEKFPELNKWIKKLKEVEIVKECVPPKEHIEHLKRNEKRVKSVYKRPT